MDPARIRKRSLRTKLVVLASTAVLAGAAGGTYAAFSSGTSSSGNTFSAAAMFAPCTTLTPTWLTGLEHGVASASGGGLFDHVQAASVDSTVKRTGSYSLRLNSPSGSSAYAAKTSGGSNLVMRFALRFASLPSADVASIASTYVGAGSNLQLGYRASDQKLTMSFGGVSPVASSTTISAGTWYVIDMKAELGSNPRTGVWRVDGVDQTGVSSAEAATVNTLAAFGSIAPSDVYSVNIDDIVASNTAADYPIGTGEVRALSPDGVDTHNGPTNFRDHSGANISSTSWNTLDEVPMDSTADGIEQRTASGASYLGFTFTNPSQSCVRAVSGVMAYRAMAEPGGPNDGRTTILDGATARTIYDGDMRGLALQYKAAVVAPTNPEWTQAAASGLIARLGHSTDAHPVPRWDSLLLEYETR